MNAGWIAVVFWVCSRIHLWTRLALRLYPKAMFACRHGAEGAWKIRLMGQKWCPLKLGGHHGLRRRCREGVLAGRILLNYVVWGNGSVSARLWNAIRTARWPEQPRGNRRLGAPRRVSAKEHADKQGDAGARLQREDRRLAAAARSTCRLPIKPLPIAGSDCPSTPSLEI